MVEDLLSLAMTIGSAALLGYWFRYTCLLILCTKTPRDYAGALAAAHQLNFLGIQGKLNEGGTANLHYLQASLNRDYAILKHMIQQCSKENTTTPMGHRILRIDYQFMACWYSLTRRFSAQAARGAVEEMSLVVAHLANAIGEGARASTCS